MSLIFFFVDDLLQYTALIWLKEFLQLDGAGILPFASGYLAAVLPCLSVTSEHRKPIRDVAYMLNKQLMKLITEDVADVDK